ncbi:regulatory protein RecX [Candidatus Koribacter versatilis Ellin345]|uniref:Regulatory protein RecX n=1 Tax=Koribacter versatilis (strain Ellin345) TaxID=204669 RepID=Q1ITU2_KORVE|nr:regulatory protein RecX [Candidatus Koribacter versatilis Ellin345]
MDLTFRFLYAFRYTSAVAFKRPARKDYTEESLYEYAIGALGRRMRSVAEMKRLMRPKVAHQEDGDRMVEAVIERLKQQKYLNDARYAETYSNNRKENQKFGRLRVTTDLKARGVHGDVIDAAMKTTYGDTDEVELAKKFVQRKRIKPLDPKDQKAAARIFRTLLRAGFSSRSAYRVLNGMKADAEILAALEAEAAEATETPENE